MMQEIIANVLKKELSEEARFDDVDGWWVWCSDSNASINCWDLAGLIMSSLKEKGFKLDG